MPAHILKSVLHFHGPIAVQSASDDPVIADCIIAIQSKPRDVHSERVSGHCSFNVERPGFRIAAENPCDAFFVRSAGINRGGVNRVSGRNCQHWFILRGKSPVESGRHKFVTFCGAFATCCDPRRGERVFFWMSRVAGIHEDHGTRHCAATYSGGSFLGSSVLILGQKMNATIGGAAFQFVAIKVACQLFAVLLQQQSEINWRTKKIGVDYPTSAKSASRSSVRLRSILCGNRAGEK